MAKSLFSRHSATHHPGDKLVTYYLTVFDLREQELNRAREQEQESEPKQAHGPEMGGMGL